MTPAAGTGSILTFADEIKSWSDADFDRFLQSLTDEETYCLLHDWEGTFARPSQLPPAGFTSGHFTFWMVQAGRGFGKTRIGAEMIRKWVMGADAATCAQLTHIIGPTAADTRDVMVEGPSGILSICPNQERPKYEPSKRRLTWPNGAITIVFSADEPERLRGPQCYKLWADEIAAWRYPDTWDQAMLGLRKGHMPQAIITTTPKPVKLVRDLARDPRCIVTRGTTHENRSNLADAFLASIVTKYEGTRLGRQELAGELLEDNPGALWNQGQIENDRWCGNDNQPMLPLPDFERVVVGVDPAATATKDSDETGIVVAARDRQHPPHFYILDDVSLVSSPDGWARVAVAAYKRHRADRMIGEANNGGDMVEATIRHVDLNISYKKVNASRGKIVRAEPVAALYEQHRVHHVGVFAELESQMCDYDPRTAEYSPDRMDALVWAMTEIGGEAEHGLLALWREQYQEQQARMAEAGNNRYQLVAEAQKGDTLLPHKYQPTAPSAGSTGRVSSTDPDRDKQVVAAGITTHCPQCNSVGLRRYGEGLWQCACGAEGRDQVQNHTITR